MACARLPGVPDVEQSTEIQTVHPGLRIKTQFSSEDDEDTDDGTDNLSCSSEGESEEPDIESHPMSNKTCPQKTMTSRTIQSQFETQRDLTLGSSGSPHSERVSHALKDKASMKQLSVRQGQSEARSPSPTFRSPHGALDWRPVMPGYHAPLRDTTRIVYQNMIDPQSPDMRSASRAMEGTRDLSLKDYIPAMSKPLAIVCFVLNILSPGLGTLLSGVSVLCCSSPRPHGTERLHCVWVNAWVSVLQLLTTFLLLLGWIWSIMWGAAFLSIAGKISTDLIDQILESQVIVSPRSRSRHQTCDIQPTARSTISIEHSTERYHNDPDHARMIYLQGTPLSTARDGAVLMQVESRPQRILNPYNPRHQRMLLRQNTEEELLPGYMLDSQALENIVIRHAPIPDHLMFGRPESQPVTERNAIYPKGYTGNDVGNSSTTGASSSGSRPPPVPSTHARNPQQPRTTQNQMVYSVTQSRAVSSNTGMSNNGGHVVRTTRPREYHNHVRN